MSAQFFCLSLAGDTGDMKNLKIYTIIQGKPKCPDLLTRWFDSKGVPPFFGFFAGNFGDTDDNRKMKESPIFFSDFLLVTLVTPLIKIETFIFFLGCVWNPSQICNDSKVMNKI